MLSNSVWVVIPAAGVGRRMQSDCPKQYLKIQDKTVLEHTLDCFLGCDTVAGIIVVVSPEDAYWPELSAQFEGFPVFTAAGGKERADSVLNGLNYLAGRDDVRNDAVVMVHDAARPCLSRRDLYLLLAAVEECSGSGALLATPVRDTMKRQRANQNSVAVIEKTEDRNGLWHALTPQLAQLQVLRMALQRAAEQGALITDEASALEFVGLQPRLLEGEASNIKITCPSDLALAEFFLQQRLREEEE